MPNVCAGHFLVGTQGLALVRHWLSADPADIAALMTELAAVAAAPDTGAFAVRFDVPDHDVASGYARWSEVYDSTPNSLIRVEQPVVRAMIDTLEPGDALDAACGTGRHTAYLAARGHRVVGVDASDAMLARARARIGAADLRRGSLEELRFPAGRFDLAVCALALTHVADLVPAIRELARVLRPGGELILSDLHPSMVLLGGTALFFDAAGAAGNVRSYHHPHAEYLAAFRSADLEVIDCAEPLVEQEDLAALSGGLAALAEEAFRKAWVGLPNALVWRLRRR